MSHPVFKPSGDLVAWRPFGSPVIEERPIRQNTRIDFSGVLVWVKSSAKEEAGEFLNFVEWSYETDTPVVETGCFSVTRRSEMWTLEMTWRWEVGALRLDARLLHDDPDRVYQLEFLAWVPWLPGSAVSGLLKGEAWRQERLPFGRTVSDFLDQGSAVHFQTAEGTEVALVSPPEGLSHVYQRGLSLKLGSTSGVAEQGVPVDFSIALTALPPKPLAAIAPAIVAAPMPSFPREERDYRAGLMLHLQYTPIAQPHRLVERWLPLVKELGFDFLMLELNRGLRAHPCVPQEAEPLESYAALAEKARAAGLEIVPMYNLLGHQNETGLLEWRPEWQETIYDGLCPGHPEVRAFARKLLGELAAAFGSRAVHIGGDELKFPGDGRATPHCPYCGVSPNLDVIVDYWNELAQAGCALSIWGDQLLPPSAVPPGLTAHNWDGRGGEYLERLDRSIGIVDWQYRPVDPEASRAFLSAKGHRVALASAGEPTLQNPFCHATLCREGRVEYALHTTWSSPHPLDAPLEGVAAAALAHGGMPYEPERVKSLSRAMAEWLAGALA